VDSCGFGLWKVTYGSERTFKSNISEFWNIDSYRYYLKQCCGSGSVSFWASRVRIPNVLGLLFDRLSLKNYLNVPSKSNNQKNLEKKYFSRYLEGH
jgi:hypothetical protein